jgi:hypothetical protein
MRKTLRKPFVNAPFTIRFALFVFGMFFQKCAPPPTEIQALPKQAIELSFQEPSSERYYNLFQQKNTLDRLEDWDSDKGLLCMTVQNNNYDSLFIYLKKRGSVLTYFSDVENTYRRESDSLIVESSNIRCFFGSDSIACLLRGEIGSFYFDGQCRYGREGLKDTSKIERLNEYSFSFRADSLGVKKYPRFSQFPCGNKLPIKSR